MSEVLSRRNSAPGCTIWLQSVECNSFNIPPGMFVYFKANPDLRYLLWTYGLWQPLSSAALTLSHGALIVVSTEMQEVLI